MTKQPIKPIYKRVLLKLSGEALLGKDGFGVDPDTVQNICHDVKEIADLGVEVGIVIGGGNIFRGEELAKTGFDRVTCDHMGMMATVMNGLVLRDSFLSLGFKSNVLSSIAIQGIVETYDRSLANSYLSKNHIVVFVAGTGNPFFSTDSAASLRGIEVKSEILLKATKVDGVYSADPKIDKNAKFFKRLTYNEVIERQLGVMDTSAFAMCRDYQLPIRVFNMYKSGILKDIVLGADEGTLIGARLEA